MAGEMLQKTAGSTVRQAYITLGTMFKSAKENGLITTMDKYVHVTDDRLLQAVAQFEKAGTQAQNSEQIVS